MSTETMTPIRIALSFEHAKRESAGLYADMTLAWELGQRAGLAAIAGTVRPSYTLMGRS